MRRKRNNKEEPPILQEMGVAEHYSSNIKLHELRTPDEPTLVYEGKMIMPAELGSRQLSELH